MKIISIKAVHADAGWRPWTFIKIETDEGLVGWSECSDSHGSPRGLEGIVLDLSAHLIGKDPRNTEALYQFLYAKTRQTPGGLIAKAIGGIENALLDIKAKALGVPVYELFGGPVRSELPLYWSHWATPQIRSAQFVGGKPIKTFKDVAVFATATKRLGYAIIKPKIALIENGKLTIFMPGFGESLGFPEVNADAKILAAIEEWTKTVQKAAGKDIGMMVDLNFNFKTEGFIKAGRMLEKYNIVWLELDSFDPDALRAVKDSVRIPIASGEDLYGARQYRPYFEKHAMDTAIVNVSWNGFMRAKQIADLAELHEINIAPHNHTGHLATFIAAQFAALIPNLRVMEYDVDDVPWREELFTNVPKIKNGVMEIPKGPGWGTEVNEKVLKAHPWPK